MAKPAFHTCHKTYSSCFSPTGFAHPPAPTCAELRVGKAAGSKAIVEDFMSVKCVPPTQRSLFMNALSLNRIQIWGVKKKTKVSWPSLGKVLRREILSKVPTQSVQLIMESRAKLSVFGSGILSLQNCWSQWPPETTQRALLCPEPLVREVWCITGGFCNADTGQRYPLGAFCACWHSCRVKWFLLQDNVNIWTKNGFFHHSFAYVSSYGTEVCANWKDWK